MTSIENIPYFDLTGQFASVKNEWFEEIEKLGSTGNFILGNAVNEFETRIAEYLKVSHAISVASGTDALVLALQAAGVGQGDSVIVPNFTFFATAEAVSLAGATPVFVDIEPDGFNIDASQIESSLDSSTKAIVPVHLFGEPANMGEICELATRRNIAVIEDVAQAFGAGAGNKYAGSWGDAGCFSFYPTKVLGAFGDGGLIVTDNDTLAGQVRLLRNHGITGTNVHSIVGRTSRLNCVQATLLQIKLDSIDEKLRRRLEIANLYVEQLVGLELDLPHPKIGTLHAYNIFTVRSPHREKIAESLKENHVGYQIYYPMPLHQQQPYRYLGYENDQFPNAMNASEECISLPLYPEIPESHVDRICAVIRDAIG